MNSPPYPTEVIAENPMSFLDHYLDCGCYSNAIEPMKESVEYWLTPRDVKDHPPEFPCLVWNAGQRDKGRKTVKFVGWYLVDDKECRIGDCDCCYEYLANVTHWLSLPPTPTEKK